MASKSLEYRQIFYHPLLSMAELESQLPPGSSLTLSTRRSISLKIRDFASGRARRNKDFKFLAGFLDHGLIELRWDIELGSESRKVRLIGANLDVVTTLLLLWHVKDPMMTSDEQRIMLNLACDKAIERKASIDIHNIPT